MTRWFRAALVFGGVFVAGLAVGVVGVGMALWVLIVEIGALGTLDLALWIFDLWIFEWLSR